MAELMRVPEVAAGATEAILSEWLKNEGESVVAGDPIAVIETEKAQVEVEAEADAVILKVLVAESSEIEIGAPMCVLGTRDEAAGDLDVILASLGLSTEISNRPAPDRRDVPDETPAVEKAPVTSDDEVSGGSVPMSPSAPEAPLRNDAGDRLFASPIARRLLREAGISPAFVTGTGPSGRIRRVDVEMAIASRSAQASAAVEAGRAANATAVSTSGSERRSVEPTGGAAPADRIEHTRMRRAIAGRLVSSKQSIPHFYVTRSASIDALLALRAELNDRTGLKISVNDFVLKAVAQAHVEVPDANVVWTDDAMLRFDTIDIAVAVASEKGLVTPVLRGVERMSLGRISAAVKSHVENANAGKLQQKDIEGGSISVTNLGMYGVDEFSAIINPPHSAILAVGAGKPSPIVVDGRLEVATVMRLVLSADHRAIDGALAAIWMQALVSLLEEPYKLLV